ncbi:MAG TPA: UDP-2,3-diacylglucosamine diphosphatase, partial [Acidobacteriota bacterium]|nr:UDP-2,3-diacylglucosamine diphosphatase [Acidobacteriota bacterium]
MNLRVVSDLHLNPTSEERNGRFLDFLQDALEKKDQVLIVGDLFDLWFGWPQLQFKFQANILIKMNDLAESGLRMDYVEGNRDFGIKMLPFSLFQNVTSEGMNLRWGDRIIYAEHGDLINKSDKQYRYFRKLTKNSFTFSLLKNLPASWMLRLTTRLEKGLKNTNQAYRVRYPEEHCKVFREAAFAKGADIVIVGHFHEQKELKEELNSRPVLFYNLPGWESGFKYLV